MIDSYLGLSVHKNMCFNDIFSFEANYGKGDPTWNYMILRWTQLSTRVPNLAFQKRCHVDLICGIVGDSGLGDPCEVGSPNFHATQRLRLHGLTSSETWDLGPPVWTVPWDACVPPTKLEGLQGSHARWVLMM